MEFSDRVVLVTGGASGIGRAVIEAFAAQGALVAVADVNADGAEAVAATFGAGGLAVPMDVTSTESVRAGVDRVLATWARIDVLANVAGWDRIMSFVETGEELWDRVIGINFRGTLATCHAVLPHMIEAGRGAVVNTASPDDPLRPASDAMFTIAPCCASIICGRTAWQGASGPRKFRP